MNEQYVNGWTIVIRGPYSGNPYTRFQAFAYRGRPQGASSPLEVHGDVWFEWGSNTVEARTRLTAYHPFIGLTRWQNFWRWARP